MHRGPRLRRETRRHGATASSSPSRKIAVPAWRRRSSPPGSGQPSTTHSSPADGGSRTRAVSRPSTLIPREPSGCTAQPPGQSSAAHASSRGSAARAREPFAEPPRCGDGCRRRAAPAAAAARRPPRGRCRRRSSRETGGRPRRAARRRAGRPPRSRAARAARDRLGRLRLGDEAVAVRAPAPRPRPARPAAACRAAAAAAASPRRRVLEQRGDEPAGVAAVAGLRAAPGTAVE